MEMEEKKKMKVVLRMLLLLLLILVGIAMANDEAANNVYSETSTPNPPNSYWEEVRKVVNKAYSYLFPPKIDFRPGKAVEDDSGLSVEDGNVKEAVTKSFEKTKEMVEDSAKAAAQTLQKPPPHSEL
ncbi:hypothetical protein IC582_008273 [Cucumis melo]|uniref:Uncharacterized protein LOC103499155 n=2 Tax=Cucumis melo TaxID=3656 RepID=A0A1S3CDE0_CUCME|nr:uncharacterized protein LOC103499155 [Cucumis melo]KAA0065584.1 putative transmembrane protein [Cucumis melo var. makuwa]TYK07150.1 putative transmembrane protein [Cucumis melo var. makuwa]